MVLVQSRVRPRCQETEPQPCTKSGQPQPRRNRHVRPGQPGSQMRAAGITGPLLGEGSEGHLAFVVDEADEPVRLVALPALQVGLAYDPISTGVSSTFGGLMQ